jgi:hypothetical protein
VALLFRSISYRPVGKDDDGRSLRVSEIRCKFSVGAQRWSEPLFTRRTPLPGVHREKSERVKEP